MARFSKTLGFTLKVETNLPPTEEERIEASRSGGGLSRLMGGGLMAVGTRLMGLGLGMSDIQTIARELFRFGRDKIGADQMGKIIAGTPGLSQFA